MPTISLTERQKKDIDNVLSCRNVIATSRRVLTHTRAVSLSATLCVPRTDCPKLKMATDSQREGPYFNRF